MTGDHSSLLEVRVRDTAHLEALLADTPTLPPGGVPRQTVVVLSAPEETAETPAGHGEAAAAGAPR